MFIQTQTFDYKDNREEVEYIAALLDLLQTGQVVTAMKMLVKRHDQLTAQPKLKVYEQTAVYA